jgi:hypothetical protein
MSQIIPGFLEPHFMIVKTVSPGAVTGVNAAVYIKKA